MLNSPNLGVLTPDIYRDVAEMTNQADQLFRLELIQALEANTTFYEREVNFNWMSVYLPVRLLREKRTIKFASDYAARYQVPTSRICFELSEKLLMENDEQIPVTIQSSYYATLSGLRPNNDTDGENDTISFAGFKTKADGTGNFFEAATLNSMLLAQGFTITADTTAPENEKIYAVTTNSAEADVIASDNTMYKKVSSGGTAKLVVSYLKNDGSGDNDDSKLLVENYYLAVRADGNSVYNYSIRTPATTSGGTDKPTLRRSNVEEGNVTNLIMGNLYKQTVTIGVQNT